MLLCPPSACEQIPFPSMPPLEYLSRLQCFLSSCAPATASHPCYKQRAIKESCCSVLLFQFCLMSSLELINAKAHLRLLTQLSKSTLRFKDEQLLAVPFIPPTASSTIFPSFCRWPATASCSRASCVSFKLSIELLILSSCRTGSHRLRVPAFSASRLNLSKNKGLHEVNSHQA